MMRFWRDHSLTIVLAAVGTALSVIAFVFDEGKWCDLFMGLGQSCLGVALFYYLSQYFVEKAKPEDPPQC
jgi:hypothetical protein